MSRKTGSLTRRKTPSMPSREELGELERMRQNDVALRARLRSLELEVETLKSRLDSLRKAKNTTIIRREREEIRMSSPRLGRQQKSTDSIASRPSTQVGSPLLPPPPSCKHGDLQAEIDRLNAQLLAEKTAREKETEELNAQLLAERTAREKRIEELNAQLLAEKTFHEKNVKELERAHEREVERVHEERARRLEEASVVVSVNCQVSEDLTKEIERLRKENDDLVEKLREMVAMNEELRDSNLLLQGKCETLLEDLSIKEAQWTQKEEKLYSEIRKQWGERYHEWITKAEKKMEELQQVNKMLQSMLRTKQHNPDLQ